MDEQQIQEFAKMIWTDVRNRVIFVTNTGEEYLDERITAILAQHLSVLLTPLESPKNP